MKICNESDYLAAHITVLTKRSANRNWALDRVEVCWAVALRFLTPGSYADRRKSSSNLQALIMDVYLTCLLRA